MTLETFEVVYGLWQPWYKKRNTRKFDKLKNELRNIRWHTTGMWEIWTIIDELEKLHSTIKQQLKKAKRNHEDEGKLDKIRAQISELGTES